MYQHQIPRVSLPLPARALELSSPDGTVGPVAWRMDLMWAVGIIEDQEEQRLFTLNMLGKKLITIA